MLIYNNLNKEAIKHQIILLLIYSDNDKHI